MENRAKPKPQQKPVRETPQKPVRFTDWAMI